MYYSLHRRIRTILIGELQKYVNGHPFYSSLIKPDTLVNTFDFARTNVADNFNFEGRQFPIIILETTDSAEQRLSINRELGEEEAYNRVCSELSYLLTRVDDDISFTGTYVDGTWLLEIITVRNPSSEELKLRVTPITAIPGQIIGGLPNMNQYTKVGTGKVFDLRADGVYTDVIPGMRIWMDSYNSLREGVQVIVQQTAVKGKTGMLYGNRHKMTVKLKVYTHTQYQTEELVDMLLDWLQWKVPNALFYGHAIDFTTASTNGVIEKAGGSELGEETFLASVSFGLNMEHQYFVPYPTIDGYSVQLSLSLPSKVSY